MKIRTRLLLFLLPTLVSSIALVSALLAINWYKEIVEGFRTRLKSAVVSTAAMRPTEDQMEQIRDQLQVNRLYFVPVHSPDIETIPKKLHITPIYTGKEGTKVITGYAPMFDPNGYVMGLMAADIHVSLIDKKFHESLFLILFCAGFTILIVVITLFLIANKISRPVQKLNNSALAIAAGHYGESVQVSGPKEIAELANTLNTMSECLHENINRLKENSLVRERMYGEYESAMLLQHMMLQKNIDECRSDAVAVKSITFFSESPRGLLLDFPKLENPDLFQIHLAEAEEEGFEGMYQLLTQYKLSKGTLGDAHTSLLFDRTTSTLQVKGPHLPYFWSLDDKKFLEPNQGHLKVDSGDYIFFFNQGLTRFLKGQNGISDLLAKVLKVFASDGLETTTAMLQKELAFGTKRIHLKEDIHLLCFQILNP
ncbi:MAG: HAMP domain-containing protein [Parachlamydiales bacterium]|nr:HAMP domain-containing protein [Parachlamydiales bacterium]